MEKITFCGELHMTKKMFEGINKLLEIDFNEAEGDEELAEAIEWLREEYGIEVKPYNTAYSFAITFSNNTVLTLDICSGSHNYWDEWNLKDSSHRSGWRNMTTFDCLYQLDEEMEFYCNNYIYMVKVIFPDKESSKNIQKGKKIKIALSDFTKNEIELYYKIKHAHTIEDVISRTKCNINEADAIAERAEDLIDCNDRYFEAYWDCIDQAIEESEED